MCLNVKLNKCKSGDLTYQIREGHWHECRLKTGGKWQKFVLQLDENSGHDFENFEKKLDNILRLVQESENSNCE